MQENDSITPKSEITIEFIRQLEELSKLHSINKKNYTSLSKNLLSIMEHFSDFEINDISDEVKIVSTTNNKIRSSIYSINNSLISFSSQQIPTNLERNLTFKLTTTQTEIANIHILINDFEREINTLNKTVSQTTNKNDLTQLKYEIINIKPEVSIFRKNEFYNLIAINTEIYKKTILLLENFSKIKIELLDLRNKISENNNMEYLERFKEDTDLILKKYQININSLTGKLENRINNLHLSQDELINNNSLLATGVDAGLKNLSEISERIKNIEIEISEILTTESEKIKEKLSIENTSINTEVQNIINTVTDKSNEIYTAHKDFKNLVENAGIYNLTENYKNKADEEKSEYKDYRKYTTYSILAAVACTIAVFIFAFWEQSTNPTEHNYLILVSRLSISAMFFILALYTSKQAVKHYECYQENHRTFLQLAALEPFMSRMTPEEQKEIRKSLIPSYFNQNADGKFAAKGDEVDMSKMFTFMDKLSNLVPGNKKQVNEASNDAGSQK